MTLGTQPRNIVLIGYRGSGKTTVGRLLADRLGYRFVDTDERVEQQAGRTVSEIFTSAGEPAFRELERHAVAEVVLRGSQIISVGGGAVLDSENRDHVANAGVCVWLAATPGELLQRLLADERSATLRPPLTDADDALSEVVSVLKTREPLYKALADFTVDTGGLTADVVAEKILDWLDQQAGGAANG